MHGVVIQLMNGLAAALEVVAKAQHAIPPVIDTESKLMGTVSNLAAASKAVRCVQPRGPLGRAQCIKHSGDLIKHTDNTSVHGVFLDWTVNITKGRRQFAPGN